MTILIGSERVALSDTLVLDAKKALRTVLTYTITDVFALTEEESMWVSYHMDKVLENIEGLKPYVIPSPVLHEIKTAEYSKRLLSLSSSTNKAHQSVVERADVNDWATVLSDMIVQSYHIRPMVIASIVGQISGVLIELGVGNSDNPRAAKYLPNVMRYLINSSL